MTGKLVFVTVLLDQYRDKSISLEELSRAFNEDVDWDYEWDYPEGKTLKGNTWLRVHDAFVNGILSREDYLYVAQAYEEYQLQLEYS